MHICGEGGEGVAGLVADHLPPLPASPVNRGSYQRLISFGTTSPAKAPIIARIAVRAAHPFPSPALRSRRPLWLMPEQDISKLW